MEDDLAELLINLNDLNINDADEQMEEETKYPQIIDKKYEPPIIYENLFNAVLAIIEKDPRFTSEIVDNVVIIKNILYGINLQLDESENDCKAILRLPESYKENIPRRNDFSLLEEKFECFDELRVHLRNSSDDESNRFIENNLLDKFENNLLDKIENKIIELASIVVQKECENNRKVKYNIDLFEMYEIASYLENFFYRNNIGSFYSDKQLIDNKYFIDFNQPVLDRFKNSKHYSYNKELYIDNVNDALLKVLHYSQNMLILFGPFGYDALYSNKKILGKLDLQAVFEFKRESLRYFALNNLIELKLYNKKIHLKDLNDYVNIIFEGASIL